jgi:hypothetical protein
MNWLKRDPYYIDSACGRFRINEAQVFGKPVYMLVERGEIAAVGSLADCKATAEAMEAKA